MKEKQMLFVSLADGVIKGAAKERIRKADWSEFSKDKAPHQFGYDPERTKQGFLGEQVALAGLGLTLYESYNFDALYRGPVEGTIEVKTIVSAMPTSGPLPHYVCVVNTPPGEPIRQRADIIVFVRLHRIDKKHIGDRAWIVGWMPFREFKARCDYTPMGEYLAGVKLEREDAYHMEIKDTRPMSLFGAQQATMFEGAEKEKAVDLPLH